MTTHAHHLRRALVAAILAAGLVVPGVAAASVPNANPGPFWATGSAECTYPGGRDIIVYPPAPTVRPPANGYTYWWRSGLTTWDGRTNTYRPGLAGANTYNDSAWNSQQITQPQFDFKQFPSAGYQYFRPVENGWLGHDQYTYVWVQTFYEINGTFYNGDTRWLQNGTTWAEGARNGWCWWQ